MSVNFDVVKIYYNDIYDPYTLKPKYQDSREVYAIRIDGEYFILGERGIGVHICDLGDEDDVLRATKELEVCDE